MGGRNPCPSEEGWEESKSDDERSFNDCQRRSTPQFNDRSSTTGVAVITVIELEQRGEGNAIDSCWRHLAAVYISPRYLRPM